MGRRKAPTEPPAEILSGSPEETESFGERIGALLSAGDVVLLHGELGAGKTTFVRGLARGLGVDAERVKSPTFVLMREYPGRVPLVHVDGYRLHGADEAAWLDLEDVFGPEKVTVIEWPERFDTLVPEERIDVILTLVSTHRRRLQVGGRGAAADRIRHAASGAAS